MRVVTAALTHGSLALCRLCVLQLGLVEAFDVLQGLLVADGGRIGQRVLLFCEAVT